MVHIVQVGVVVMAHMNSKLPMSFIQFPIADVCIIGYPDERLGSRLAAVVVATADTTLESLRSHCQSIGLDKAKWPELIIHIEAIPLSPIGKVKRGDLEDLVWGIVKQQGTLSVQ